MQEPVVSICCLVYNHEPFLRECFEGFVMQKTTFPIEILVHDDASTDHSADIIREYTVQYPDLFKPIYQTENQYSKGVKVSATFQFPRAKGKYIALCEGDDYWTDPYKLQKQVDFLESHPEYVMCSHVFDRYIQSERVIQSSTNIDWAGKTYTQENVIRGDWPIQTATVVFKRKALDINHFCKFRITTDTVLFYALMKEGKGVCLSDSMSVYRVHQNGVWSGTNEAQQWARCISVLLSIFEVEKSKEAAEFVRTGLLYGVGRRTYLENLRLSYLLIRVVAKYKGWPYVLKWLWNKFVLGEDLEK